MHMSSTQANHMTHPYVCSTPRYHSRYSFLSTLSRGSTAASCSKYLRKFCQRNSTFRNYTLKHNYGLLLIFNHQWITTLINTIYINIYTFHMTKSKNLRCPKPLQFLQNMAVYWFTPRKDTLYSAVVCQCATLKLQMCNIKKKIDLWCHYDHFFSKI